MPARRRPSLSGLAAGLLLAGGCAAPEPPPPAPAGRPDLLIVTVDTLRPDALGWVSGGDHTPVLDALAAEGVAFPAAASPVPLTLPSHASMFSGLLPRRHGVRDNHQVLGPRPPLLAERLSGAGYRTGAVVSGYPLTAPFGLDRGFDDYDDTLTAGEGAWLERPAGETAAAAIAWLARRDASPWFLWVHFYDPHFPHEPPPEHRLPGPRGGYDGEAAYVDAELAAVLAAARSAARGELLTVFASDHGESLGEHGENTHGFFVYESTQRVPLVFHWPGRLAPARRGEAARLVDLGPTVLDLLGLEPFPDAGGVSLAPLLAGEAGPPPPPAYLETVQPWTSYGWAPLAAVRHDGWKLIAAPRPELYDLAADPGESVDRFADEPQRARRLGRLLREFEAAEVAAAEASDDPETRERLRALGYLGGSAAEEIPPRQALPDPKDRLRLRELLTEADERLRADDPAAAARLFLRALAEEPSNRFAQVRLGLALHRSGDSEAALPELARAVELDPHDPETRTAYAEVLAAVGRHAPAAEQWMEVVRMQPRHAAGWSNLGATLGLSGRAAEALVAYRRAAELEPDDAERRVRLGFAAFAAGEVGEAVAALEEAAELTGVDAFPHPGALGLLLLRQGERRRAVEWLRRSRPREGDFLDARLALVRLELDAGRRGQAGLLLREALAARPDLGPRIERDRRLADLLR